MLGDPAIDVPASVLDAYGFSDDARNPIVGGLINQTFRIVREGQPIAVVQRLHAIFGPQVNLDLDAITGHLARVGLLTPRLVRTRAGHPWVELEGQVWRALSHIEGTTVHRIEQPATAHAAGELVGRFHRAVADLSHEYAFARSGVHDTKAHLAALAAECDRPENQSLDAEARDLVARARELGAEILDAASQRPSLSGLPLRHCHGDLKISNILFAPGDATRALCLLDLDTLGRQTIAYEMGDALRSWCNPRGENIARANLDREILAAAMAGYRSSVGDLLTAAEWASIIPGLQNICVELASRFCVDVFRDEYFGWDATRYSSRRQHNLLRARGQLDLARSVERQRTDLQRLVLARA